MLLDGQTRRVAIYARISQDREGAGLGVDRQERECRELAARLGWEVAEVFKDDDVSAYSGKRRERYLDLLEAIGRGEVDGLIVWHTDRLHRSVRELLDFLDLVRARGDFAIQTVRAGQVDLSTPTGRALAVTFGAWAQQESEHKADRIRSKARELAEAGKIGGGGTRPFGYEPDRLTVRESEAALIRRAARDVLDGTATIHGIVRRWNAAGVLTSAGNAWAPHSVRRLLMSARISGRREHHKVIKSTAVWGKIIEPEESDRLRELLADPRRTTNKVGSARRYLLTGMLFCGAPPIHQVDSPHGGAPQGVSEVDALCGLRMKARPQGDHQRSYVCAGPGFAHLRMIAEPLELYVKEGALSYLDEFVGLASAIEQSQPDHAREAELWQSLANYQRRLEKVQGDFYVHERLTEEAFGRLSGELEAEIGRARRELSRVRTRREATELPSSSAHARKLWEGWSLERRRAFVSALVVRVVIGPGVRGRNKFDPGRVHVTWRRPY